LIEIECEWAESSELFIEDQAFSLSYDLAPHPPPPSLSQSSWSSLLTEEGEGGGGGTLVLYKSFNTLSLWVATIGTKAAVSL
jgi:hypothetical protein